MRQMISGMVAAAAIVAQALRPQWHVEGCSRVDALHACHTAPAFRVIIQAITGVTASLAMRACRLRPSIIMSIKGRCSAVPATSHRCRPIRKVPLPDGMPTVVLISILTTAVVMPTPCITTMMARP